MTGIKSIYVNSFLFLSVALISIHPVFFPSRFSYITVLLYLIVLAFFQYYGEETGRDKKGARSLMLLGPGMLMISAAQYIFSFFMQRTAGAASIMMIAGGVLVFLSSRTGLDVRENKEPRVKGIYEILFLVLITAAAFFLRIYKINEIPLGVWFDEAQNGNEVISMLATNRFEVFIPRLTQMPAMFTWLASVFVKIMGPEILSLKMVSIILGTLCVPAFYFLAKRVFGSARYAAAAAVLLAFSRWHITFSRVAFLGMQTIFIEILFFYFYIRMIEDNKWYFAALAGFIAGIGLYSFSSANMVVVIAAAHLFITFLKDKEMFVKKQLKKVMIAGAIGLITAAPLITYAVNNWQDYTRRVKDINITQEIKEKGSLKPLLLSVKLHLLMFNFEGDYNGRHNLYKAPLVDNISGVLLVAGVFTAAAAAGANSLWLLWFFLMLLPGMMTITIEAPQAYRASSVIPALYMLILIAFRKIENGLFLLGKKISRFNIAAVVIITAIAVINVHQYFVVYPSQKSAYMDYSPEANGISRLVNQQSKDWYFYVSEAKKMYGFYSFEQKVILTFTTHKKARFSYLSGAQNNVYPSYLQGRKGIGIVVRPSDTDVIDSIKAQFPEAVPEITDNPHTGEEIYRCYYVEKEKLQQSKKGLFELSQTEVINDED
ncbi:MAG: glycosyltransferase family 39 protein [Candidatus Goldbacteria bacterium]|nr:glycosyltransferase family 39 protein [Candidatus Goldiibacteriota bacterium]